MNGCDGNKDLVIHASAMDNRMDMPTSFVEIAIFIN